MTASEPAGIGELYRRFRASLAGAASPAPPPASAAEIAATESALGHALPDDLRDLYRTHNGGCLFDARQWLPCVEGGDGPGGLPAATRTHLAMIRDTLLPEGLVSYVPGPRTLAIAVASQEALLYEVDDFPGRILYLDVLANPAIVPAAPNLETLLRLWIRLAELGYLAVVEGDIESTRPPETVADVFDEYGVNLAIETGIVDSGP